MTESRLLPVPDGLAGERVDVGLARLVGLSRSRAAALIDEGAVEVDGAVVGRSHRLAGGSLLAVTLPDPQPEPEVVAEEVPGLEVRFQDGDLVVLDKPVGVAAHASPGWEGPTVTAGALAKGIVLSTSGPAERQGIVHRLDAGTSGLMVLAKTDLAYRSLKAQFKNRTVSKIYHALVQGHPDPVEGTIDAPIGRSPSADYKFAVTSAGKPSITHYRVDEMLRYASLLHIRLETGRTHQIRVHMAAIRHPCAGDLTYGADPALAKRLGLRRQWLHAVELGFDHPRSGERIEVTSPYPADLRVALERLRD